MKRIETQTLAVGYGKQVLLEDISIQVMPGKIVTLIGPNGSGKSTILKTITKQLKVLGGSIYLDGKCMEQMSGAEIAKSLSMVMTERPRPELMTCREVIATGRYPYTGRLGILGEKDKKAVDEAIELLHAKDIADKSFLEISDGQRQRVMLARALCQEPKVLILDEPTSFLDMRYKLEILNHIKQLARSKEIAILMSLHELDLAHQISDEVVCVDGTHIAKYASAKEVFEGDFIQTLYGVSKESFDEKSGMLFLQKTQKEPSVFVIGGGGCAIETYYQLARDGVSFVAGILYENDMEYKVAKSLASQVIEAKAFYPMDEKSYARAKEWIDSCKRCICCMTDFGPLSDKNRQLMEYARNQEKLEWQK